MQGNPCLLNLNLHVHNLKAVDEAINIKTKLNITYTLRDEKEVWNVYTI